MFDQTELKPKPKPCLFLDRDGVIIKDTGYPHELKDCQVLPEIIEIIQWAKKNSWLTIVLSNQAGIAKGVFSVKDYELFTQHLHETLASQGAAPDAWYYCPYHPEGTVPEFRKDSSLRKPGAGMLLQAQREHNVDLNRSIMIGDRMSDVLELTGPQYLLLRGAYPIDPSYPLAFNEHGDILNFLKQQLPLSSQRESTDLSPKMNSIVIIPTYNERENIGPLLQQIWISCPHLHVLVVDDNSPDRTGAFVKELQERMEMEDPQSPKKLFLLSREKKNGLGRAYLAGFQWALSRGYQKLVEMDADFSHDPKRLQAMLDGLDHHDFVIGSRYVPEGGVENWNLFRKILSLTGSFYARTILGIAIQDFTGGYNAWKAQVLQTIDLGTVRSEGYNFQIELKYKAAKKGFHFKEIPILFSERRAGQSKMSLRIVLEAIVGVWKLR